jgi:nicotinamidase-related amidase
MPECLLVVDMQKDYFPGGAMSHMCIDATTRAAADMGFACWVAEDACATRDLVFNDRAVAAAQVHAAFMAELAAAYAQVTPTDAIMAEMV